jgi:pseudouridine kinase
MFWLQAGALPFAPFKLGWISMTAKRFVVIGGCHIDQHLYFDTAPVAGRTNPARIVEAIGGVAANIAHHLAAAQYAVDFVGVQPQHDPLSLALRLQTAGISAHLTPIAAEAPRYTALIGPDGELVIGAAALSIYDAVTEDVLRSGLEASLSGRLPADAVVIDANFPAPVFQMLGHTLPADLPLCAAATSLAKVDRLAAMLPRLSVLVLNRAEASHLVGIQLDDVAVLAGTLAASMSGNRSGNMLEDGLVLVSDGGSMAALATGDAVVTALPPSVRVISANGAGDAMAAALFSAVLEAGPVFDLDDMLRGAVAAGADFASRLVAGQSIVGQE